MDPTSVFCPNSMCPARGHVNQGHISIHSRLEKRFICTQCHKTFAAAKGTVFYRLRTSTELVVTVVTWLAHGCPVQRRAPHGGWHAGTRRDAQATLAW
jgi:transposase-like protein